MGRYSKTMKSSLVYTILAVVGTAPMFWGLGISVEDDAMAPTIETGDRIWGWPTEAVLPGDIVMINDPLDPNIPIIRRVLAVAGQSIAIDERMIRVGNRRLRTTAMGDAADYVVTKETLWAKKPAIGHSWLTRFPKDSSSRWSADPVSVPEGHVFLMADDRDHAMDSRWWGPVPVELVRRTIRFRWGASHEWRKKWEWMVGTQPIRD